MGLETKYIWENGNIVNWEDSKEHTVCHGLHYGTGVFEGIRFYNTANGPKIFRLDKHIERLFYSASCLDIYEIDIGFNQQEIIEACQNLVEKNGVEDGYIRPIIYYGYGKMGLDPTGAQVNALISVWPWGKYLSQEEASVGISNYRRLSADSAVMDAKITGYYFNSVLAHKDAKNRGFDEALLYDHDGNIAEGPGENIFFIKDNTLYTPQKGTILPGITRDSIITIAQEDFGYEVKETTIKEEDMDSFDEAFFVGTAAEVTPIGDITRQDGKKFLFDSDNSKKLGDFYAKVVRGEIKKYKDWLF